MDKATAIYQQKWSAKWWFIIICKKQTWDEVIEKSPNEGSNTRADRSVQKSLKSPPISIPENIQILSTTISQCNIHNCIRDMPDSSSP